MKPRPKQSAPKHPQVHRRNRFKKTETRRLLTAVREAGLTVAKIECDSITGKVSIFPGAPVETTPEGNAWDSVLKP